MRAACVLLLGLAAMAPAQMTMDEKVFDFQSLVVQYNKNYAPYEWKRDALKYNMFDVAPWTARVRDTKDDLDFFEVCTQYVTSLQDGHSVLRMQSVYRARLPLTLDIYDGKVLIDSLTRSSLPVATFPFQVGDEVISVDGKPVEELIAYYRKFVSAPFERVSRRIAAGYIVSRSQSIIPRAHEVGATAKMEIRMASGTTGTYDVPWTVIGTAVTGAGRVDPPTLKNARDGAGAGDGISQMRRPWMEPLRKYHSLLAATTQEAALGMGAVTPYYGMPTGFQTRLGAKSSDYFYSGVFQAGGFRIGFIRIPTFDPSSEWGALSQFETEIEYFNANTDGLIVDITRNGGGDGCYTEALVQYLMPWRFRTMGFEMRANVVALDSFARLVELSNRYELDDDSILRYIDAYQEVKRAFNSNRGLTKPLPLCGDNLIVSPAEITYAKPLMLLTDEMSASAAEMFPAVLQDAGRVRIFGYRTMGAGGSVVSDYAGIYSESLTNYTATLMSRNDSRAVADYPASPYVENVGVRPDVEYDYMTRDNLMNRGGTFVASFTSAMVEHIQKSR